VVDDHVKVSMQTSSVVGGREMVSMLASSVVDDYVMVSYHYIIIYHTRG
jgi:hypothetical protein